MPITASEVKSPTGEVDGTVWFPSLSSGAVDTLLAGYITDAYTRTDDDDAATQWVYYRAASAVADRLAGVASSRAMALEGQGSKSETVSAGQFKYWADKAAAYLAAFNALTEEPEADDIDGWRTLTSLRTRA